MKNEIEVPMKETQLNKEIKEDPIFEFEIKRVNYYKKNTPPIIHRKSQENHITLPRIPEHCSSQVQRQSKPRKRIKSQHYSELFDSCFKANAKKSDSKITYKIELTRDLDETEKDIMEIAEKLKESIKTRKDIKRYMRNDGILRKINELAQENQELKVENFQLKQISEFTPSNLKNYE